MGVELTDMFISLKPRDQWKKAKTQAELTDLIQKEIRPFLGPRFSFSQPIELRMDEMVSGVRADLAVKLFGDDIKTLQKTRGRDREGLEDNRRQRRRQRRTAHRAARPAGQDQAGRNRPPRRPRQSGARPGRIAWAACTLGEIVEGQFRFPLVIRLPETYRGTIKRGDDAKS